MTTTTLTTELQQLPDEVRAQLASVVLANSFTGVISAELASAVSRQLGLSVEALMLKLVPLARTYAYPPISKFYVGAVVRAASGDLIFGANLEFPGTALNTTVHAEQAAVLHAMQRGETGISTIAVNGSPCGHCRQFLTEINNPNLTVITPRIDNQPISTLLPEAFTPDSLNNPNGLLDPADHGLTLDSTEPDELTTAALQMANRSYAPYSKNWAGVAVRTQSGQIIAAPYAENAAFNPSLSPLNGVVVVMRMMGVAWDEIEEAVLVEQGESLCSQALATRGLLSAVGEISVRVVRL